MSQQTKSEMMSNGEADRSNFNPNQNISDASKKQKGKPGVQLNMNPQDNGLKVRNSISAFWLLISLKKSNSRKLQAMRWQQRLPLLVMT